jgi:hypothetical protein
MPILVMTIVKEVGYKTSEKLNDKVNLTLNSVKHLIHCKNLN